LIEHKLVICDSNSGAWFEGDGHHHTLIIHESSVSAAKIHDLVLETIVTTHYRMLAGNMVPQ
jgi:hypothetical protein